MTAAMPARGVAPKSGNANDELTPAELTVRASKFQ